MLTSNHRPSRAAVDRALREVAVLWTPPDDSSNVVPFRRPLRTCRGCGQHLRDGEGAATCAKCEAWDRLLRGMSIARQGLGDLAL